MSNVRWLLIGAGIALSLGCGQKPALWDTSSGVVVQTGDTTGIGEQVLAATAAVPQNAMAGTGLAGVAGGAHVKLLRSGPQYVRLPIPQMSDCQIPVWYGIAAAPRQSLAECRISGQAGGNCFVTIKLDGSKGQEVQISWSSVVLVTGRTIFVADESDAGAYLSPTQCVQSDDKKIAGLAGQLWPASGSKHEYASNIQRFISEMKQKDQPRSLDALGILKSGLGFICTANANLACALMRAKQIPCRSLAVIPPISQRLEMHRIVEFFNGKDWTQFDPSLLQKDIPLKPWHSIILAKTGISDEEVAMKPRMGAMVGCPFGQELEISGAGLTLSGNDFFWTIGAPLAVFEVSDEAAALTQQAWSAYLKSGKPSAAQISAASARDPGRYIEAIKGS